MDGLTAVRLIRSRADTRAAVPIIIITTADTIAMQELFDAIGRTLAPQ